MSADSPPTALESSIDIDKTELEIRRNCSVIRKRNFLVTIDSRHIMIITYWRITRKMNSCFCCNKGSTRRTAAVTSTLRHPKESDS